MIAQDLEAERAVLGAALVDPAVLPAAASVLSPADFARPAHRAIFAALLSAEAGGQVDLVTVKSQLADRRSSSRPRAAPSTWAASWTASRVSARPRSWPGRGGCGSEPGFAGIAAQLDRLRARAEEPEATADELGAALSDVALERDVVGAGVLDRAEVARRTWALIDEEITGRGTGLTTGLPALNRRLRFNGWRPGQLVYVGARTSRGKSALLLGHGRIRGRRGPAGAHVFARDDAGRAGSAAPRGRGGRGRGRRLRLETRGARGAPSSAWAP